MNRPGCAHFDFSGFAAFSEDKANIKLGKGWGVVRKAPWSLFGYFPTQAQTWESCEETGEVFEVRSGSKRLGSNDDFIM
jgi:hypothetical protein